MPICPACQALLQAESQFCNRCGAAIPLDGADLPLASAVAYASRLLSQGEVDRAITLLEPHALDTAPDAAALFALGTAYLQRGRYADALPLLREAAEQGPGYARTHAYLAMAYLHTYQPAEARAAMERAVALAPDDFAVNLKHGELLIRLGYYREGIAPLEHALAGPAPDAASLASARRLLSFARQQAPNTFTRPVNRFPRLRWPWRGHDRRTADRVQRSAPTPSHS